MLLLTFFVLLALLLLGVFSMRVARKVISKPDDFHFDLPELQRLRQDGMLSDAEFELLVKTHVERRRARGESAKPVTLGPRGFDVVVRPPGDQHSTPRE